MKESELLSKIGITDLGEYSEDGTYVVDIMEYDTYGKYYSKLEKSDLVEEIPSTSLINIHNTDVKYRTTDSIEGGFIINILADLDNDEYKLVVQKTGRAQQNED